MKVLKCERCGEIFFEDDGSDKEIRSFEDFICLDCSDEISKQHQVDIIKSSNNCTYGG